MVEKNLLDEYEFDFIESKKNKFFLLKDVALKFISKLGKTEKDLYFLRREIDILRKMKHENIVEMINSFETDDQVSCTIDRGMIFYFVLRLWLLRNVVSLIFINC